VSEDTARTILLLGGGYAALGLAFAAVFAARGAARLDGAVRGASLGFRLLLVPGSVALWPLLLRRWIGAGRRDERPQNAHDRAAERAAR